MKKIVGILILFLLIVTSCSGQKNDNAKSKANENQPKTNIQVNKEYDEFGNLIKYDSMYSYFYSNIENDIFLRDSIINQFKRNFNKQYLFSRDPFFNDFFFQDSLLNFDFYTNDFFINRYRNNIEQMNQLFMEMDSIKNLFFREQVLEPRKKKDIIL